MVTFFVLMASLVIQAPPAATPETFQAILDEGVRLHDAGDYDGAIAAYARVLAVDPLNDHAIHETAFSLMQKGAVAEAVDLCRRALAAGMPSHPGIHLTLANALDNQGQAAESEKVYRQALKTWPKAQQLHFNLAVNLLHQGKIEAAEKELDESIALGDTHPGTWNALAGLSKASLRASDAWLASLRFVTLSPPGAKREAAARDLWALIFENIDAGEPAGSGEAKRDVKITLNENEKVMGQQFMLAMMGASRFVEENEKLSDAQFFAKAVDSLTTIIGELGPEKSKHDWPVVIRAYLADLRAGGHVEALAWTLRDAAGDPEATAWMASHQGPVAAYRAWNQGWSFVGR